MTKSDQTSLNESAKRLCTTDYMLFLYNQQFYIDGQYRDLLNLDYCQGNIDASYQYIQYRDKLMSFNNITATYRYYAICVLHK